MTASICENKLESLMLFRTLGAKFKNREGKEETRYLYAIDRGGAHGSEDASPIIQHQALRATVDQIMELAVRARAISQNHLLLSCRPECPNRLA